jgi:hypothetical protein
VTFGRDEERHLPPDQAFRLEELGVAQRDGQFGPGVHHRGAAVGAPQQPLVVEVGEVAPHGRGGDAQGIRELGEGDRLVHGQEVENLDHAARALVRRRRTQLAIRLHEASSG